MKNTFTTLALLSFVAILSHAQKIVITPSMLTNIVAKGNENVLIDEQNLDPKTTPNNKPKSNKFTIEESNGAINPLYLPMEVVIDLKREYDLTDIYFYFLNGSTDSIFFYAGTPKNWGTTFVLGKPMNGYDTWVGTPVTIKTRYLKIKIKTHEVQIREIMLYGSSTAAVVPDPTPTGTPPVPKTMWNLAGSNVFEDGWADSILAVSGSHRVYYDLRWFDFDLTTPYPNNKYTFGKFNLDSRNLDNFFKAWKQKNIHQVLTIKENSERFIVANGNANNSHLWKPIANNANAENPAAYLEHADAMYQIAARYGATAVALSNLRVNTVVSPALSGLNYINYIENGNENNKNWIDRKSYWTPFEYAAMSSADCDGHEGTMGARLGMKTADPTMKLVMAATISPDTAYVKAMAFWTTHFRTDKKFVWDVINIHHYSNNGGGQTGDFNTGVSPEQDNLLKKLKETVAFCRKYWPSKEVWWSEFGYDLSLDSPQHTPIISGQNAEKVQANMIVRSFLIAAAAGIDRAQQYMLRHALFKANYPGLFNSCGLVEEGGYDAGFGGIVPPKPHPSWYAMYTMRNALKNFVFDKVETSGNNNVYVYKFKHQTLADSVAYALWCPTANNTTVTGYALSIPQLTSATKVEYADKNKKGVRGSLTASGGAVTVNVSESPMYVLAKLSTNSVNVETETIYKSMLLVSPNPCQDILNVNATIQGTFEIFDLNGKMVQKQLLPLGSTNLDVSQLRKGIYTCRFQTQHGSESTKFIKE
jgi:hypothetical protein